MSRDCISMRVCRPFHINSFSLERSVLGARFKMVIAIVQTLQRRLAIGGQIWLANWRHSAGEESWLNNWNISIGFLTGR
jgi:hypothetical protein